MEYIFQVLDEYIEGNVTKEPSTLRERVVPTEQMYQVDELEKAHMHNQLYTDYLCLIKKYDTIIKKNIEYQDLLASSTARVRDLEEAINTIMVHADYFKNELASYKDVDDMNMERNYIYI
jgi:hypothetical protein